MPLNTIDELLRFARLTLEVVKVEECEDALDHASDMVEFLAPEDPSPRSTRVNPIRRRSEINFATSELYERIAHYLHLTAPPKQILQVLNLSLGCVLPDTLIQVSLNDNKRTLTIKDFYDIRIRDVDAPYKIFTPTGFEPVGQVIMKPNKRVRRLTLANDMSLACSHDHLVMTSEGWNYAPLVDVGSTMLMTCSGLSRVVDMEDLDFLDTYDLQVLTNDHAYYSNGIVSHNTDFPTPDLVQSAFQKAADRYRQKGEEWANRIQPITAAIDVAG